MIGGLKLQDTTGWVVQRWTECGKTPIEFWANVFRRVVEFGPYCAQRGYVPDKPRVRIYNV